jgi:hypothetical protein
MGNIAGGDGRFFGKEESFGELLGDFLALYAPIWVPPIFLRLDHPVLFTAFSPTKIPQHTSHRL